MENNLPDEFKDLPTPQLLKSPIIEDTHALSEYERKRKHLERVMSISLPRRSVLHAHTGLLFYLDSLKEEQWNQPSDEHFDYYKGVEDTLSKLDTILKQQEGE